MANESNNLCSQEQVFHQFHMSCFMNYNIMQDDIAESDIAAFDTVMWISLIMTGTVGTSLLLGIIYYERYMAVMLYLNDRKNTYRPTSSGYSFL